MISHVYDVRARESRRWINWTELSHIYKIFLSIPNLKDLNAQTGFEGEERSDAKNQKVEKLLIFDSSFDGWRGHPKIFDDAKSK